MTQTAAVNVELHMTVRDGGVAESVKGIEQAAAKSAQAVHQANQAAVASSTQAAAAIEQAAQKAAAATEQSTQRQRTSHERLSHARETLGIRSEQTIQREIDQTVAAYNRLQRDGKLSFDEQARAAEATRLKVEKLTNEMGKLTAEQEKAAKAAKDAADQEERIAQRRAKWQTAAAVGAGGAAAGYALRDPARQTMAFEERLGLLANTAYAEYGPDGRKIGEAQIRAAVSRALDTGLTRDQALDAIEKLVADNQVGGIKGAMEALPFLGKTATGSGSSGRDSAALMGGLIASGYAKDVAAAKRQMGIASAAATAGAFEKGDMARHLPALLPLAKSAGLTGEDGFRRLLVLLQQAKSTAGTSDEAATNVRNLLAKLQSGDTAKDFEKHGRGDLSKYLMQQRAQGVDPLTAWQNVIESEIAKNPNLKPALANLKAAKNKDEQDAAIEAIKGMAAGQSMGKFFQDMQAQGALFGLRNEKVAADVNQALRLAPTIIETDYQYMAGKPGVKARVYEERKEFAKMEAMDQATPVLGELADAASRVLREFPLLSGATITATGAITAFATAAGVATLAMGGRMPPKMGEAIDKAAQAASGPAGQKAIRAAKTAGVASAAALVGGAALDAVAGEDSALSRYGSKALNGAALGATVGSVIPVLGTGAGAAVGAAGGLAWAGVEDLLRPSPPSGERMSLSPPPLHPAPAAARPAPQAAREPRTPAHAAPPGPVISGERRSLSPAQIYVAPAAARPAPQAALSAAAIAAPKVLREQRDQRDKTELSATVNVGLAPGLVVTGQRSATNGPGFVRFNTGSIWSGAPQ